MTENKLRFSINKQVPQALGMEEAIIGNVLSFVPSAIMGLFFASGTAGTLLFILLILASGFPPILILIPLSCLFLSLLIFYFSPFLLNVNYYIQMLLGHCQTLPDKTGYAFQIMTNPRQQFDIRGFLEDADDIGFLKLTKDGIEFKGSYIDGLVPYDQIKSVKMLTSGWRGMWCISGRLHVLMNNPGGIQEIYLGERHSSSIPGGWKITRQLYGEIKDKVGKNEK